MIYLFIKFISKLDRKNLIKTKTEYGNWIEMIKSQAMQNMIDRL